MSVDRAGALKRALVNPTALVAALVVKRAVRQHGGGLTIPCPSHSDDTPSCSVTLGPDRTIRVHCFGACGLDGDAFTLIAAVRGLDVRRDFPAVLDIAASIAGEPITYEAPSTRPSLRPRITPTTNELDDATFAALLAPLLHLGRLDEGPIAKDVALYLARRSILAEAIVDGWAALPSDDEAQRSWTKMLDDVFGAAVAIRSRLVVLEDSRLGFVHAANRLVIPWRDLDGRVYTVQRRRLDDGRPKYVFPRGRSPRFPYGAERLAHARPTTAIVFCEGAVDVLARRVLDASADRVVLGVPGVDGWRSEWASLARGRSAFIATDADDAGERVVATWGADLYRAGAVSVKRLAPARAKDWADALERARA